MLSRHARSLGQSFAPRPACVVASSHRPFITVAQKYVEGYKRYGLRDCLWKLYNEGDIKFGKKVGEDRFGTQYYFDPTEVSGQQRWCEYKHDFSNVYDASQVPPEWHAWLHHITDEVPPADAASSGLTRANAEPLVSKWAHVPISSISHAPYANHLGPVDPQAFQENVTGKKSRGYRVGSLTCGPNEEDGTYQQPNHPARKFRRPVEDAARDPVRDPSLT